MTAVERTFVCFPGRRRAQAELGVALPRSGLICAFGHGLDAAPSHFEVAAP
ncbi:MAG: hypothetical protein IT372_41455 [Polyangiaceae bacterium]|nr:hypothetical protein [Polyangiaceae bacterium]